MDQAGIVRIGHGHWAAIGVKRHIGLHVQQVVGPNARGAGDGRAAGVHQGGHAVFFGRSDHGRVFIGCFHRTKPCFGQPHALAGDVSEVLLEQARFKDDGPGPDPHAAGAVGFKAFHRRHGQGLDPFRVFRSARHMDF